MEEKDFENAMKVSFTTMEEGEVKTSGIKVHENSIAMKEEGEEDEYIPTHSLLQVRSITYLEPDEEEKMYETTKKPELKPNEKLYAQALEGKADTEREEKKKKLLDFRG